MKRWKTVYSDTLVDTDWVRVCKDAVDLPNGQHIDDFYTMPLNDAVSIVADRCGEKYYSEKKNIGIVWTKI